MIGVVGVSGLDRPVAREISFFESVAVLEILLGEHYRRLGSLFRSLLAEVSSRLCSYDAAELRPQTIRCSRQSLANSS